MNFDDVNNQILSRLEKDGLFWRKGFSRGVPKNYFTNRPYSGINNYLLCQENAQTPFYATFLQLKENNLFLKAGSKSSRVIFWKILEVSSENELTRIPYLKYYYVFNMDCVKDFTLPELPKSEPQKLLLEILSKFKISFEHTFEGKACYKPKIDKITMPHFTLFKNQNEYYSTFFHEISHWCLNPSKNRIPRPTLKNEFSDYGFEELIAELSACYICSVAGVEFTLDNSAAYLNNWIKAAKLNKYFFYRASFYSQKIVNYLLNIPE